MTPNDGTKIEVYLLEDGSERKIGEAKIQSAIAQQESPYAWTHWPQYDFTPTDFSGLGSEADRQRAERIRKAKIALDKRECADDLPIPRPP